MALLTVGGPVTKRATAWSAAVGGMDAEAIGAVLGEVEFDDAVRAVIVNIDSPGGSCAAGHALIDAIERVQPSMRMPLRHT